MTFHEFLAVAKTWAIKALRAAPGRFKLLVLGPDTPSSEPFQAGRVLRLSASVVIGFLVLFGLWAAIVPLESAVMAQGVVAVESKRKKVQHLEGGILEPIAVRDGDSVRAGQVLAVLNQTDSAAAVNVLLSEQDAILAQEARLRAEMNDEAALNFAPELLVRRGVPAAVAAQTKFSTIKVDRSFVQGAAKNAAESLAIIRAVVALADSLGMTTTAEGVETEEECKMVNKLGCRKIQGYLYGRPMPATDARALLGAEPERAVA